MSCTDLLETKEYYFVTVTGIRKTATNEKKVSTENPLLYREGKVILHMSKKKNENFALRLSYGNKKSYKE